MIILSVCVVMGRGARREQAGTGGVSLGEGTLNSREPRGGKGRDPLEGSKRGGGLETLSFFSRWSRLSPFLLDGDFFKVRIFKTSRSHFSYKNKNRKQP